jgi:ribosomal protein S18 acetylase RimI-like enzyme
MPLPPSLALQTEIALWQTRGSVIARAGYWVVRTPSDLGYYFGNLLLLPSAPKAEEIALWQARFAEEFASTAVKHVTLWWDQGLLDSAATRELTDRGFTVAATEVLTCDVGHMTMATGVSGFEIRTLQPQQAVLLAELAISFADRHDDNYVEFLNRRARWQQQLMQRGLAQFVAAFDGDSAVASLGIFFHHRLARFQDVQTASGFRRRGLCTSLIRRAAELARQRGATTLVIHAEPQHQAAKLYRSLGFSSVEVTTSACRYPPRCP